MEPTTTCQDTGYENLHRPLSFSGHRLGRTQLSLSLSLSTSLTLLQVRNNGSRKQMHLGSFVNKDDAIRAFDYFVIWLRGTDAQPNHRYLLDGMKFDDPVPIGGKTNGTSDVREIDLDALRQVSPAIELV